jgi:murein DD-endopeptidase MepM/ murein hydrolase activator NlpD
VHVAGEKSSAYRFYPGAKFVPEEEALFRGLLIHFPLPSEALTTGFEMDESRAAHRMAHHAGIDLTAPAGTEVYAARAGLVTDAGSNKVFGQYIVITHDGNWSTVYGHLSARRVRLNDSVESGMILGNLGSTGESTGSYLHFEVRMPQGR